jgi:hypothetical protein
MVGHFKVEGHLGGFFGGMCGGAREDIGQLVMEHISILWFFLEYHRMITYYHLQHTYIYNIYNIYLYVCIHIYI